MWQWLKIIQSLVARTGRAHRRDAAAPPQRPAADAKAPHPPVVARHGGPRLRHSLPDEVTELTDLSERMYPISPEQAALIHHWRKGRGKVYVLSTQATVLTTIRLEGELLRVVAGQSNQTLKTAAGKSGMVLSVLFKEGAVSVYRGHYLLLVPRADQQYEDDRTVLG